LSGLFFFKELLIKLWKTENLDRIFQIVRGFRIFRGFQIFRFQIRKSLNPILKSEKNRWSDFKVQIQSLIFEIRKVFSDFKTIGYPIRIRKNLNFQTSWLGLNFYCKRYFVSVEEGRLSLKIKSNNCHTLDCWIVWWIINYLSRHY